MTTNDDLLTASDLAKMLQVRVKRIYELGLPVIRLAPRTLRWRRSEVERWLGERTKGGPQ